MDIHNEEWIEEQKRVDDTVNKVKRKEEALKASVHLVKAEAEEIRKNFWEDVTVNLDEPDDVIETYTSIRQQAELLSERERSYGHVEENVKTLQRLAYSPYFARIDFQESDEPLEKIYIGIASFINGNDEHLVYDWRAPISSIYYDGVPGPVSYQTPEGSRLGEMTLKRQFLIRDGKIEAMFDTGMTIGDEMLLEMLGAKANTYMKNIVSTIQKEQNKIIRDTKSNLLFVQGAAGSGKTSAALQRIAFLLYHFRDSLQAEQIILFSPNKLFNSYISKVLPELGENNMQQTTFLDYAQSRLGPVLEAESLFEQFENRVNDELIEAGWRREAIRIKGSLAFFHAVQAYASSLINKGLVFRDIRFRGETIISKESIAELFYSYDRSYSMPNRMTLVAKKILRKLGEIAKEEEKSEWVEAEMELLDREDYLNAYRHSQKGGKKGKERYDSFDKEKGFLAKEIVNQHFARLRRMVKRYRFLNLKAQYIECLKRIPDCVDRSSLSFNIEDWTSILEHTAGHMQERRIHMEDVVPFLLLGDLTTGKRSQRSMKHVFIDEIQDYSEAQLAYLKFLFPYSKFTMLGDINQTIYGHGQQTLMDSVLKIMGEERAEIVRLKKSYRSTLPITRFTKEILSGGEDIELFEREGELPIVSVVPDKMTQIELIAKRANELAKESHSVAIIGKSMKECEEAYHHLKEKLDITLVGTKNTELAEGVILLPSYLAKGLEFDDVIILNASNDMYTDESERTLLYTMCTRAMHQLYVVSVGRPTHLLDAVPEEFYYLKHY
jgi:DNA helicase-2/ATP-dependent DNA helicase PcrA